MAPKEGLANFALELGEGDADTNSNTIAASTTASSGVILTESNEPMKSSPSHAVSIPDPEDIPVFEDLPHSPGSFMLRVEAVFEVASSTVEAKSNVIRTGFVVLAVVLYHVYFFGAVYYAVVSGNGVDWCHGLGFLIIITVITYWIVLHGKIKRAIKASMRWLVGKCDSLQKLPRSISSLAKSSWAWQWAAPLAQVGVYLAVVIFLLLDNANKARFTAFFGLLVLILTGLVFSKYPCRIRWRHVTWGVGLQYIMGLAMLRWDFGRDVFQCIADKATTFLNYSEDGSSFLFGYLVNQKAFDPSAVNETSPAFQVIKDINDSGALSFVLMFKVLSVIYFSSFMVSMLFHLGAMQWLVHNIGWLLQISVGTTACESMAAAANIFLGQAEAPLMIKPYLWQMTESELHCVMTGGFATIAGAVLAAYVSFDIPAAHLITASVMSAPAALAASKLLWPETKRSLTNSDSLPVMKSDKANLLDAAGAGAQEAVFLVANIAATLIAVLAFIGFLNGVLGWLGTLVGLEGLSFEFILGKVFVPLAWLMGIDDKDLSEVGTLIGLKTFVNEFTAYDRLRHLGSTISPRSRLIATYALCGFSNPSSIGIQIATLGTLAPSRRQDVARVAFRALIGGSIACFMTACVAGSLID